MTNAQTEARAIVVQVVHEVNGGKPGGHQRAAGIVATALAAKDAELAELRAYAFEATKAITGLTVGGSEFFGKRIGEMYTADLPYCVEHIKDRERRAHKRWLEEREKRQRAEAQLAEANKALVIANANLDNMEFLSIEGFMDWQQEHRAARRALKGGQEE